MTKLKACALAVTLPLWVLPWSVYQVYQDLLTEFKYR